ncbi:MAG TPA: hypothetical protein VFR52_02190 [Sphingomicrobium sp.]|nr:hypothetical protein [Sphingomicrobium sp.]
MMSGLPIALLFAAQAAADSSYGPAPPPAPKPKAAASASACAAPPVDKDKGEIFVCAPRPEGYRIDPDVLKASKQARNRTKPKRPERLVDTSCATVGPHGCMSTGIDLLNAALVAATMAQKAISGGNVGQMFVTDPTPSEYELYKLAKSEREAKEAEQATSAKVKAIREKGAVTE